MMTAAVSFDHLAVGVRSWPEGFQRFARELGGQWSHGGDAGEFAPCQLTYPSGIKIELIAPGYEPGGFMHRFMARSGPGPHHLTFKVASLPATVDALSGLGIEVLGGRTGLPFWREVFGHPRQCGIGTLLQVAQVDESAMPGQGTPPPPGFPAEQEPARSVAWVGLTAETVERACALFAGVLEGDVAEEGSGWVRISWGPGQDLLVRGSTSRPAAAVPGHAALWPSQKLGVTHVVFGPAGLTVKELESGDAAVSPMPFDPATTVPVWLAAPPA
jgi:Glyoxalase/Bleomycin resistance protein/Dioxygenase superfamily